jgi:hypothetical protein
MTEPAKEQKEMIKTQALDLAQQFTAVIHAGNYDKRALVYASTKMAAGMCRAARMDKHAAVTLFMSLLSEADEFFKAQGK